MAKKPATVKASARTLSSAKPPARKGPLAKDHVKKAKAAPAKTQKKVEKKAPLKPAASVKAAAPKAAVAPAAASKPLAAPPKATASKATLPLKAPGKPAEAGHAARPIAAAAVKHAGQTVTAQATPAKPATAAAQAAAVHAAAAAAANKKPVNQRHGFKTNEWIVYPAHGVGRIVGIEEQEIAGISLELFVITFEKDKMTLRVPTGKSQSVGMRKLAEEGTVRKAMETLKGKARVKRTMWSRRAQEYEAKINSGDLIAIAEVVRDLYRSESQPEQSYSERQLYEAALDRMAREIAAVEKLDERGAVQRITEVLAKSAKGRRIAAEEAEIKAA
jgi:CarD family transcriptional regulator